MGKGGQSTIVPDPFRFAPVAFSQVPPQLEGGYEENRGHHQAFQNGRSERRLGRIGHRRSDRE